MKKHYQQLDEMIRELVSSGAIVTEMKMVCYLLISLSKSYEGIITAIKTMPDNTLTMGFVKKIILEHEQKLKKEEEDTSAKVLNIFKLTEKPRRNNYKGKRISNKWSKNNFSQRSNNHTFKNRDYRNGPKCYFCGRRNRRIKDCQFHKQQLKWLENKTKNNRQQNSEILSAEKEAFAFMMCTDNVKQSFKTPNFIFDTGATEHLINDLQMYSTHKKLSEPIKISVAKKNTAVYATHMGNISIQTNIRCSGILQNVLFAEEVPYNLLSVRRLQEAGMTIIFANTGEVLVKKQEKIIMKGKRMNDLQVVQFNIQNVHTVSKPIIVASTTLNNNKLWHDRLGHKSLGFVMRIMC